MTDDRIRHLPPPIPMSGEISAFTHHRTLDPVRAAALAAAVDAITTLMPGTNLTVESVLRTAAEFEAWLDPKEDDGQA